MEFLEDMSEESLLFPYSNCIYVLFFYLMTKAYQIHLINFLEWNSTIIQVHAFLKN